MKKLGTLMALVAVAGLMLITAPQDAHARPKYRLAMQKKFDKVTDQVEEKKCAVCHGGDPLGLNKKILSDFAKGLKEALGKKNELDDAKINAALDKAAKKPIKEGEKTTFGELLSDGKLPPPAPKEAEE